MRTFDICPSFWLHWACECGQLANRGVTGGPQNRSCGADALETRSRGRAARKPHPPVPTHHDQPMQASDTSPSSTTRLASQPRRGAFQPVVGRLRDHHVLRSSDMRQPALKRWLSVRHRHSTERHPRSVSTRPSDIAVLGDVCRVFSIATSVDHPEASTVTLRRAGGSTHPP